MWTPSPDADQNLKRDGIAPEKIAMIGNIMIDSLVMMTPVIRMETARESPGLVDKTYGVVTLHRPSNVDNPDVLNRLSQALTGIAKQTPLVFPVHPRTAKNLHEFGLYNSLNDSPGIILKEPLGYKAFVNL